MASHTVEITVPTRRRHLSSYGQARLAQRWPRSGAGVGVGAGNPTARSRLRVQFITTSTRCGRARDYHQGAGQDAAGHPARRWSRRSRALAAPLALPATRYPGRTPALRRAHHAAISLRISPCGIRHPGSPQRARARGLRAGRLSRPLTARAGSGWDGWPMSSCGCAARSTRCSPVVARAGRWAVSGCGTRPGACRRPRDHPGPQAAGPTGQAGAVRRRDRAGGDRGHPGAWLRR
jgi:hypothetical protein